MYRHCVNSILVSLQDVRLHPDWSDCYNMGSKSLLDIHTAFAASDLSFRVPLWVNNKRQNVSLATLFQQNLGELYMQAVAGLHDFAPQARAGPDSKEGHHLSMGACQSQALMACLLETPSQIAKLADAHLMKHAKEGRGVSGEDVMRRLEEGVRHCHLLSRLGTTTDCGPSNCCQACIKLLCTDMLPSSEPRIQDWHNFLVEACRSFVSMHASPSPSPSVRATCSV